MARQTAHAVSGRPPINSSEHPSLRPFSCCIVTSVDGIALYPRRAETMALEALADTRVVVVNGARQVGKSTLAADR